ncbi:hypothetical protein C8F01DRAFT_1382519, partial [Mycena amicta]
YKRAGSDSLLLAGILLYNGYAGAATLSPTIPQPTTHTPTVNLVEQPKCKSRQGRRLGELWRVECDGGFLHRRTRQERRRQTRRSPDRACRHQGHCRGSPPRLLGNSHRRRSHRRHCRRHCHRRLG